MNLYASLNKVENYIVWNTGGAILLGVLLYMICRRSRHPILVLMPAVAMGFLGTQVAGLHEGTGRDASNLIYSFPTSVIQWCKQIWGLILGALIYTGPCCMVVVMLAREREQRRKISEPCCERCGYSLKGLMTPRCPECGLPFNPYRIDNRPPPATKEDRAGEH